jgi:hypothetical protein
LKQVLAKYKVNDKTFGELIYRTVLPKGKGAWGIFTIAALHGSLDLFFDLASRQGFDDNDLPLPKDYKPSAKYNTMVCGWQSSSYFLDDDLIYF